MKRLYRLRHLMEANDLSALILFEGDFIAYRLALTQHFNIVVVTINDTYVLADTTQYRETLRESPWNIVFVEDFTLNKLVRVITSMLSGQGRDFKPRPGVNKAWVGVSALTSTQI